MREPKPASAFAPRHIVEHAPLIPAYAGIQGNKRRSLRPWIHAFAGMSGNDVDRIPAEHALFRLDRVGERLERCKMKIRLGQRGDSRRSAKTLLPLAALDPADLVAKRPRDADVVVLALRHVQDFVLSVAMRRLASAIVREELRIGLGAAGFVGGDAVVKRV